MASNLRTAFTNRTLFGVGKYLYHGMWLISDKNPSAKLISADWNSFILGEGVVNKLRRLPKWTYQFLRKLNIKRTALQFFCKPPLRGIRHGVWPREVPTGSARPCRSNSSSLHSPFFGSMAKIDHLTEDAYITWNNIGCHALQTRLEDTAVAVNLKLHTAHMHECKSLRSPPGLLLQPKPRRMTTPARRYGTGRRAAANLLSIEYL